MIHTAIAGAPRSGKTTLAATIGDVVLHTDDVQGMGWSESSEHASYWFDDGNTDVIEGVGAIRALRKWLARNPTGKPCETLIYLHLPREPLNDGQQRMAKGSMTIYQGIKDDLVSRGVKIEEP